MTWIETRIETKISPTRIETMIGTTMGGRYYSQDDTDGVPLVVGH